MDAVSGKRHHGQEVDHPMRQGFAHRGFSLVEMAMVMATMAIIAMIAVPRMSRAADDAHAGALVANVRVLQGAIEMYAIEHGGLSPGQKADQSIDLSGARFAQRLTGLTTELGNTGGIYGPYLLRIPRNPGNEKDTIRVNGPDLGANLAGWRFNTTTRRILPDHVTELVAETVIRTKLLGATVKDVSGGRNTLEDGEQAAGLN